MKNYLVCMYVNGVGTEATLADLLCLPVLLLHQQSCACNEAQYLA
jgi:hypothetical protein